MRRRTKPMPENLDLYGDFRLSWLLHLLWREYLISLILTTFTDCVCLSWYPWINLDLIKLKTQAVINYNLSHLNLAFLRDLFQITLMTIPSSILRVGGSSLDSKNLASVPLRKMPLETQITIIQESSWPHTDSNYARYANCSCHYSS